MKLNTLAIVILVALLGLAMYLLWSNKKETIRLTALNQDQNTKIQGCTEGKKMAIQSLNDIMKVQWRLEGLHVKKGLYLINMKNERVSFDSLFAAKANNLLILRFFFSNCEDCQYQEMQFLDALPKKDNILVIGSYQSAKDFRLYMQGLGVDLEAYQLEGTEIMFEGLERKVNAAFTFTLDKGYKANNVHIGNASFPMLSESYYETIMTKFDY